jgi:hypothetical protein
MPVLRARDPFVDRSCQRTSDACVIEKKKCGWDWLPPILLLAVTLPFRDRLANWIFMWLFVTAMFAGCKWLTWRQARRTTTTGSSTLRTLGYLFAWPGMDASTFLFHKYDAKPRVGEWLLAAGRFVAGVALVLLAADSTFTGQPVINAWIAMFGLVLLLHFGALHLAALAWRCAGVPAKPLMNSPLRATSLADFWGARWNTAFSKLVHDAAFRPLARRAGVAGATMGVFALSGIIHELSISFPARGGYGLPFAYFIVQGVGVLVERSKAGSALGLGRGFRGWLFVVLLTAGPAYWLFHPIFVENVILPMLQTIGAT